MLIDTHSHLQFKVFDKNRDEVIKRAKESGVTKIIAVGTDLQSSKKAVEISEKYPQIFASVGIHPHHLFENRNYLKDLEEIEKLVRNPKVAAIGETGIDKYLYKITKYPNYLISKQFLNLQKEIFWLQIKLALKHNRALIIHNREAVKETLEVLEKNWDDKLRNRSVFHFCEPDNRLLDFAKSHNIFIGVDGDVLTDKTKQEFVKKIPLGLLVLETDSPFISKEPKDLKIILEFVSKLLKIDKEKLEEVTFKKSKLLFKL